MKYKGRAYRSKNGEIWIVREERAHILEVECSGYGRKVNKISKRDFRSLKKAFHLRPVSLITALMMLMKGKDGTKKVFTCL